MVEANPGHIAHIKNWLGSGSINLFGSPFAGKDTQGRMLAKLLEAPLLGGGDILRGSEIPAHVEASMQAGELIPTADYLQIVLPYLSKPNFAGKPLVLSSVGRWHGEEPGVLAATEASGHPVRAVFFLQISEDTVRQRWQTAQQRKDRGSRYDDNPKALDIRLEEFRKKTLPVINFYRDNGLLIEIDGTKSPNDVSQLIIDHLDKLAVSA